MPLLAGMCAPRALALSTLTAVRLALQALRQRHVLLHGMGAEVGAVFMRGQGMHGMHSTCCGSQAQPAQQLKNSA